MRKVASPIRRHACIAIALVLLVGGPVGTALADHARSSPEEDIWHVSHFVNATVVDNYATVRVGVDIVNEGPDPEFPFRVELPEDAYVTGLVITRDGETFEAEIQDDEQARQRYEQAKEEDRSAGLVEQQREDDVYAYNVNVEGQERVQAVLTYERYLTAEAGAYELELEAPATHRGVDEGARIDAWIQHDAGIQDAQATPEGDVEQTSEGVHASRNVGPRGHGHATDLRVGYELAATDPGGALAVSVEDGVGYFAHRFRAQDAHERMPIDLSLVLDTSGSMQGDKIAQLEQATRQLVDELGPEDRLHITFFDGRTEQPWQGFARVDANLTDRAFQALDHVRATGSTDIGAAIEDGFAPFNAEEADERRLPALVFLTDGRATEGISDEQRLRTKALEANQAGAHVFSLAFGQQADWGLVHGLAEDGQGLARQIEADAGAEMDLRSFMTALTSPVLTDVSIAYEDASTTSWRLGAPVLFADSELVFVGTFDANLTELAAQVTARGPDTSHAWNLTSPVEGQGPSYLSDLVAYQRIQALEDRIQAEGGNQTLVDEVTALALEHGFVTDHTSLVVDLPRQPPADAPADGGQETHRPTQGTDARSGYDQDDQATDPSPAPTSGENEAPPTDGAEEPGEDAVETPGVGVVASLVACLVVAVAGSRRS